MEYHEINFGHGELEVTSKYPKGMSNRQLALTARVWGEVWVENFQTMHIQMVSEWTDMDHLGKMN